MNAKSAQVVEDPGDLTASGFVTTVGLDPGSRVCQSGEESEGHMKYTVAFKRNDRVGLEEYEAGDTIQQARREAQFFAQNLPRWVDVKICTVNRQGHLEVHEIFRGSKQETE